ncbi:unnamed protein product [Phytophthora fragariaefolia]|uniref:Unnamed protein product n=1 Tax=Phytophthora fragariaefolia TaxID=1490495 RepID=A0A9W7DD08_9STRA|nr:unnamed protein product [Phytophthora fragariaefolia]
MASEVPLHSDPVSYDGSDYSDAPDETVILVETPNEALGSMNGEENGECLHMIGNFNLETFKLKNQSTRPREASLLPIKGIHMHDITLGLLPRIIGEVSTRGLVIRPSYS